MNGMRTGSRETIGRRRGTSRARSTRMPSGAGTATPRSRPDADGLASDRRAGSATELLATSRRALRLADPQAGECRPVDELAMPQLEDEQGPDRLSVIVATRCMPVEQLPRRILAEVAPRSRGTVQKRLASEIA